MSKYLSAKYYQNNEERLHKNLRKDIEVFLKKKMKKSDSIVMRDTKMSQKRKRKSCLIIEKKCYKMKKTLAADWDGCYVLNN